MDNKHRKIQLELAFPGADRGETPRPPAEGSERSTAAQTHESPAGNELADENLMEEICADEIVAMALKQVQANKGAPGADGMTVRALGRHVRRHWPEIREQLLSGTYTPKPVLRREIPKPGGGVRKLGIPTVLDRMI